MLLEGRVAMVTGGGKGIGRACALMLAQHGADLAICDIDGAAGQSVAGEIEALGRSALPCRADSSDSAAVRGAFGEVAQHFGKVDILVNNAGIALYGTIRDLSEETWDRVVDVHLKSMFLCSQAAVELMIPGGWGRIVNIVSRAAFKGRAGTGPYAAAKAGMVAFARVLAVECAEWGITVNNVAPGTTLTPMVKSGFATEDAQREEARSSGVLTRPLRLAEPDEIAAAVLYLCGAHADHVTGTTMHVNGGTFMP